MLIYFYQAMIALSGPLKHFCKDVQDNDSFSVATKAVSKSGDQGHLCFFIDFSHSTSDLIKCDKILIQFAT